MDSNRSQTPQKQILAHLARRPFVESVRRELKGIVLFVAAIWGVFLIDQVTKFEQWGLVPRTLTGLVGIVTMTFLHKDFGHIISNTFPLLILLALLAATNVRSRRIVIAIILIGGGLTWLFGSSKNHIGASLLIFGLITFILASGFYFQRSPLQTIIALLVGLLYGIPLIQGVIPRVWTTSDVAWDGHLFGAVAGIVVAYGAVAVTRKRNQTELTANTTRGPAS